MPDQPKQKFDGVLSMFIEEPKEPDANHLEFQRWLIQHHRLESPIDGDAPLPDTMMDILRKFVSDFRENEEIDGLMVRRALEGSYGSNDIITFIRQLDQADAFTLAENGPLIGTSASIKAALEKIEQETPVVAPI